MLSENISIGNLEKNILKIIKKYKNKNKNYIQLNEVKNKQKYT